MLALIWRVVKEKANTIAVQRRSRVVFLLTRVSENSLRTSCSVGKNINMCSVMSRLHVAKNTWSFKMCKGSLQFQRMRATQASMSTFCRPPLPTPPHSRRILQRLPKRRRFGTSTCPLFLELLTCLLKDLSLASFWTFGWASFADPWARLSWCLMRMLWLGQCACARTFLLIRKAITCLLAKSTQQPPEATIVSWMSWSNWPTKQATLCASTSRCRRQQTPATSRAMLNLWTLVLMAPTTLSLTFQSAVTITPSPKLQPFRRGSQGPASLLLLPACCHLLSRLLHLLLLLALRKPGPRSLGFGDHPGEGSEHSVPWPVWSLFGARIHLVYTWQKS